ncbi:MAG TPA: tetratricopeptide repeat protein [Stellaceae bacterium]|nr:tetratricopeptide repeat protein [Stellaceae bacterium]
MTASSDALEAARQHHLAGRLAEAEAGYGGILARDPSHAEAVHSLGLLAYQQGRADEGVALLRQSIALAPDVAYFGPNLATVLTELGRFAEAEACCRSFLAQGPADAAAHYHLGNALMGLGRLAEAEASFRDALRLKSDFAEAHNNRGNALRAFRRLAEAEAAYREALRLKPAYPEALSNLGCVLQALGGLAEAEACYRDALHLAPDTAVTHTNLGTVLRDLGRLDEAEVCHREALRLKPHFLEAWTNLGNTLADMGNPRAAIPCCRHALGLDPKCAQAHVSLALALLAIGEFDEGWAAYEWRLAGVGGFDLDRSFPQPRWRGEETGGRTLLLHAEQGFGDAMQFVRYAPLVAARADVVLEVPEPLVRLFKSLPGKGRIVARGEALPPFDLQCSLMSLPFVFQTRLATIPGEVPYLAADPDAALAWRRRLDAFQGLKVGLVWAGNPRLAQPQATAIDRRRSMPLDRLAPLAAVPGVTFVSLQKGEARAQLRRSAFAPLMPDWTEELQDFADTAALIEALDLVISVDTAVVHLAGALGKPVWLLNRFDACWRWLEGRDDSPWYPSLRQFRQSAPGDWEGVVARVAAELARLAAPEGGEARPGEGARPASAAALDRAIALHRAGDLAAAERLYRALLAENQGHGDALHLLGLIAHQRGDSEAGLQLVDRAIAAGQRSAEIMSNRGMILQALGRSADALASFEAAAALMPGRAEYRAHCGNMLHLLQRSEAALARYEAALALRPDFPEALSNRGVVLHHLGRFEAALASYEAALALRGDYADALDNRGTTLAALQRFAEALASHEAALALQPSRAETHYRRANALKALNRLDEALAGYDRALALRPDYAEALGNRAATFYALGRHAEAVVCWRRAAALRPDDAGIIANLAAALAEAGDFAAALAQYEALLALMPEDPAAQYGRAAALRDLGRFEEALAGFDAALRLRPDYAEALNERGNALYSLRRFESALASYDAALALRPDLADAHNNRANALRALGRSEAALASYDAALARTPLDARVLSNRGLLLHGMGRFDEALASYARAQAIDPGLASAHWNEALSRLLLGDFARGWEKYEWRWQTPDFAPERRQFSRPLWLGREALAGRTILLHAEQGLGDTLQFCRYAPHLAAAGATILLGAPPPLVPLLHSLAGLAWLGARGDALPAFDFHCPLLSLPRACGTGLETIPAPIPYLHAAPERIAAIAPLLPPPAPLRIGLVWSGRAAHPNDRNRSLALERLDPLLALPGIAYVSLQRELRPADAAALARRPAITPLGEHLGDFADTAAAVAALDLVVTVDTSVAHLAGAMGKRVWILLPYVPDWRWLLQREDSPWYPSARLFRQAAPGDWDAVIARVAAALSALACAARAGP